MGQENRQWIDLAAIPADFRLRVFLKSEPPSQWRVFVLAKTRIDAPDEDDIIANHKLFGYKHLINIYSIHRTIKKTLVSTCDLDNLLSMHLCLTRCKGSFSWGQVGTYRRISR